ncbi:MAG: DUF192 domain-containing protein [Rhodobacterales bacterium]
MWAGCADGRASFRMGGSRAAFDVDVVDTFKGRAKGLMYRTSLPKFSGMLFLYPREQSVSFWMRNTLIPLDMIFMDATGTVVSVHTNAIPGDETPVFGGNNILAVLEINGGLAETLHIQPGAMMQHPRLDQKKAAWPCEK